MKLFTIVSGLLTRSRPALVLAAAALLIGGSMSEASAKSRHHHHHHYGKHAGKKHYGKSHYGKRHYGKSHSRKWRHARVHAGASSWRDANASIAPVATGGGRSFSGMASYYGSESGSRTASGARFNPGGLTAAHRSLPFGTRLRVTHGGRSVVVTVNDRGPFIGGRVLDLSKGAASAIGLTSRGVGRVVAEVM